MPRNRNNRPLRSVVISTTAPPSEPAALVEHIYRLTDHREEIRALVAAELAETPKPSARVERRAEIKALRTWREAASARLDDLAAGRVPIEPERAADLQRRLVGRMSKNSLRLATLEGAERRWHVAVKEARSGIDLRRGLRPDARLHLEHARATFMLEGNSPRLRNDLKAAAAAVPASKGIAYWRARYALMTGGHAEALEAVRETRDYPPIRNIILPLLEPESADAPWLSWPCNFYTYRYSLATDDQLRGMQSALAALSSNPELEQVWTGLGIPASAIALLRHRAADAAIALEALQFWNQANIDMTRSRYASAVKNYEACQRAIISYFAARFALSLPDPADESGSDTTPSDQLENALEQLARGVIRYNAPTRHIWTFFRERNMAMTLEELHTHDWRRPNVVPLAYEFSSPLPNYGAATDFATALARLLTQMSILKSLQTEGDKVEEKIDAPLVALALVFCPLGIAEANRLRRNFDDALSQCRQLLRRHAQLSILSEVIEKPFVKILKAQILLDKADAQYKARALAHSPATNPDGSLRYQGLEAAETYQGVLAAFEDQGQYVNRVNAGVATMQTELASLLGHTIDPIALKERAVTQPAMAATDRHALVTFGKRIAIETMVSRHGEYPNPDRRVRPHESLLKFEAPEGLLETNPVIYSLILQARARLLQMESGLNYLGYSDDYIPPWRFQYLIDRSRYFAEHAKNAQRDYLNFLSNAEREDLQEITAAQNVEMEKSNIRIESARVEQVKLEVESSKASEELARLTAENAQRRLDAYRAFDRRAQQLSGDGTLGMMVGGLFSVLPDHFAEAATSAIDFFTGGAASKALDRRIAILQRGYEKYSLLLVTTEAEQSAVVASRQLAVAQQGLVVAGLQRAAAVLRHEFAVQSLAFLRNRTLSSELWYRLAGALRGVADTYLRYAVELAFLAEQAYELESDKRVDVIRFDYDVSDLGDMLAGDFLLRDLDTLEQDLIVSQRSRQQAVRYVLSLAREFPEALQDLRDAGHTIFSLRLEQIERRFPGLFNVRVSAVDVLPLALMDSSRFSLEVTHLGVGQVRLKADPAATEEATADWIESVTTDWAVKQRVQGPESAIFSGLSRQEVAQGPLAASQLGAFEGRPGASAWRIDMSMRENRVVADTLADVIITFNLTGYHDATLRDVIDRAPRKDTASTLWLSARQLFPDAYYQFHQSATLDWKLTPDALSLQGAVGELQNIAVVCSPAKDRPELGRLSCAFDVEFDVDAAGQVRLLRSLPRVALSTTGLTLFVVSSLPATDVLTFDCGDGSGLIGASQMPHAYARPGRYDVLVRIASNGRLTEYRAAVVVSRDHAVSPPCLAIPVLTTTVSGTTISLHPAIETSAEPLAVTWRLDGDSPGAASNPSFTLLPGRHTLSMIVVRPLKARFFSQQRYLPEVSLGLDALQLATNRTFDIISGAETTVALNQLGQHVFSGGPLSPFDRWTFELPLADNPWIVSVASNDVAQPDLSELADVFLTLEVGDVSA